MAKPPTLTSLMKKAKKIITQGERFASQDDQPSINDMNDDWYSTRHLLNDDLVEIPYPNLKEICRLLLFMREKNLQKLNGQCKNRCLESPLGISELLKMVKKKPLYFQRNIQ